jgi:protease-4
MAIGLFSTPQQKGSISITGTGDIAVIEVQGMIADPAPVIQHLKTFSERKDVKALVVRMESPGGVVAASQELYDAMVRTRATEKPLIVSMGSLAASGAYYAALGSDSIMANPGTLTGSIGVLMDFPEVTKLFNKIGIEFHSVTSGQFKDAGAPYNEWDEQSREYYESIVMDTYEQFVAVVAEERQMPVNRVREIANGKVYTGSQALDLGLVDMLGSLQEAVLLAGELAGVEGEPTVVKPRSQEMRIWDLLFGDVEQIINKLSFGPVAQYRYKISF